ncbi:Zinc finger CCCH domain-containing protein 44 [Vitis vinifera]|uniref:Zinc finger CCCH domain-containing protein 44 n=1 Tax=Vitis vinifera TaxID=29760 RepID=A0A438F5Z4_VITVI|nr:Zinc finger CCCH domain-containing protein 44 [Vitis vinifera]
MDWNSSLKEIKCLCCHDAFTLFEYLERRQLLQTESEQSRLLLEVPDIVAEEIELEAEPEEFSNNAKAGNDPLIRPIPEKISDSLMYSSAVEPVSTQISGGMDAAGQYLTGSPRYGSFKATEVIELTDDEDKQEDQIGENQSVGEHLGSLIWYYLDPQGQTQGPFSTASLKRWSDAEYFPPDFKVWKKGENQENSVLLSNMLHQSYTD